MPNAPSSAAQEANPERNQPLDSSLDSPLGKLLGKVRVVLVNTSHPGNIGATARAMRNMGLRNLVLVDPRDFPSDVATWRAVGGADILERASVVPTLQDAVADCGLVIGASARSRRIPWPVLSPRECAAKTVTDANDGNNVALVFGREDTGLSNEELQLCHFHVQIDADREYSSLNLAAAVMVIIYEVRMAALAMQTDETAEDASTPDADEEAAYWDVIKANGQQMEHFYTHLEKVLTDLKFHDPENPRLLMLRMRRLFGRIRPDQMEVSILRGVLSYVEDHVELAASRKPGTSDKD